jgi:D-proline reductase (dithiol) PrdB
MQDQGSGAPVSDMQRTRDYYRAIGYANNYVWAHHAEFVRPAKPVHVTKT